MSFPAGWHRTELNLWDREVEPVNTAICQALMTLPAATIIRYRSANYGDVEEVTRITYDPQNQEAVLT